MSHQKAPLPAALVRCARTFQTWRQTRTKRRIPEHLWTRASALARRYGTAPTARALGLDYAQLKRRLNPSDPRDASKQKGAPAGFVELMPLTGGHRAECHLELEDPQGLSVRIHLQGAGVPELRALIGAVLDRRG